MRIESSITLVVWNYVIHWHRKSYYLIAHFGLRGSLNSRLYTLAMASPRQYSALIWYCSPAVLSHKIMPLYPITNPTSLLGRASPFRPSENYGSLLMSVYGLVLGVASWSYVYDTSEAPHRHGLNNGCGNKPNQIRSEKLRDRRTYPLFIVNNRITGDWPLQFVTRTGNAISPSRGLFNSGHTKHPCLSRIASKIPKAQWVERYKAWEGLPRKTREEEKRPKRRKTLHHETNIFRQDSYS